MPTGRRDTLRRVTPEDLRAAAEQLDQEALELGKAGRLHEGVRKMQEATNLRRMADEAERLAVFGKHGKVSGMTDHQRLERAGAIARAQPGKKDRLQKAIQASQWKTHNRYAKKRLGFSPASLTKWKQGDAPVPPKVAQILQDDFGITLPLKR